MVNSRLPNRQSIRLQGYDYSQAGAYFITICTQNRLHLFGRIVDGEMVLNDAGQMIQRIWHEIPRDFAHIQLHEFIIMPNHIHGIIEIIGGVGVGADSISARIAKQAPPQSRATVEFRADMESAPTVGMVVQSFKRHSTIEYIRMVKNGVLSRFNQKIWQRNYWEHIIRNEQEHHRIAQYICNNPLKWEMDKLNHDCSGNQVMESAVEYNHEVWMI